MKNLESCVLISNRSGASFTYLSTRKTQCFEHDSFKPKAMSSRKVERREMGMNPSLGYRKVVPLETPTRENAQVVDSHGEHLCTLGPGEDGKGESLPKVIEPHSLDHLLRNPLARGESFGARICHILDSLVADILQPCTLKPMVDPHIVLSGACAPVCETKPTRCRIVYGRLPDDLNGAYLRNGPNPSLLQRGDGFHLFDGDGMIHSIMLRNGSVSFCSRFVQTSRFRQEQASERPVIPKFFGGIIGLYGVARVLVMILRAVFGLVDITQGLGSSNTSVAFFNGHILSLSQEDLPYIVKVTEDGDLLTSRQFKLPSKYNMCAHPKFDPVTGEMYAFSFDAPFLPPFSIFRVSADGVKSADIRVPLLGIPLVHDFAITRRFIIFPDHQLVLRPTELAKGKMPLTCDFNKISRFCLMPRYGPSAELAASKAQWFDAPGVNCLHYFNAWEEGPYEVVLITSVLSPVERILRIPQNCTSCLTEIRFNRRTGSVKQRIICSGANLEFGVINQAYTGRKTRYAYLASGGYPYFEGVVKVDLLTHEEQGAIVGKRDFGEGKYGGEPFFVAARGAKSEDHGYVLCVVGDEKGSQVSQLLVMDALSPTLEVITAIELPVRVPVGFHGCFVDEEQLARQKP